MSYRGGCGDERSSEIDDPAKFHLSFPGIGPIGDSARVIDIRQGHQTRASSQNQKSVAERDGHFKKSNILTPHRNTEIPAVFEPRERLRIDERVSRHLAHAASLPPEAAVPGAPPPRSTTPRSGIFFGGLRGAASELLTSLALLALILPWFIGLAAILRWLWMRLP